jgi:hypothetical protein
MTFADSTVLAAQSFTAQRLVRTNLPHVSAVRHRAKASWGHVLVVVIMVLPVPVCYLRRVRCARRVSLATRSEICPRRTCVYLK